MAMRQGHAPLSGRLTAPALGEAVGVLNRNLNSPLGDMLLEGVDGNRKIATAVTFTKADTIAAGLDAVFTARRCRAPCIVSVINCVFDLYSLTITHEIFSRSCSVFARYCLAKHSWVPNWFIFWLK